MEKKKLSIGIEDFAKLRNNNFYYVDKTGMIKELLNNWGEVNLFTRPRRFGKSINMSMLKYFFEIGTDKSLFDGLAISEEKELCEKYMGQFPVISISLKAIEGADYSAARSMAVDVINEEARSFGFLLDSPNFTSYEKELLAAMMDKNMDDAALISSIRNLTELLKKHYGKKVIVLIDEYDVPLIKANECGYHSEMMNLIQSMFHHALKTNYNLKFAVMTGRLHVFRGNIFTGFNNIKRSSIFEAACDDKFGFTDEEVKEMLDYYGFSEYYDVTKEWYDGYKIGKENVYNPWDVLNWCDQLLTESNKTPMSYWSNSSGNVEVRKFIQRMGNGVTKTQIERLISGDTVQKKIEEQLTYDTMYESVENIWSLLFYTGYLTPSETPMGTVVRLKIPNSEVRAIFRDSILELFENKIKNDTAGVNDFCEALKSGNAPEVERLFTDFMKTTVSIRDTAVRKEFKESFYHGLLLGILGFKDGWSVDSNRESGEGYYDIAVEIEDEEIGIVIEVKYAENAQFEKECERALKQINDNDYTAELKYDGMRTLLKYGIACYKNRCMVSVESEEYDPD